MIDVVIPSRPEDVELAWKNQAVQERRAGVGPINTHVAVDRDRIGWVAMHNMVFQRLRGDYYLYSCADYFPGRDYLRIAWDAMARTGASLVGFNDGKWQGKIATVGLVRREWAERNYDGDLFFSGYKSHGADDELTNLAMRDGVYHYEPNAVLVEVDYEKDFKASNPDDGRLYRARGYGKHLREWMND
jgi:hypothetical protein